MKKASLLTILFALLSISVVFAYSGSYTSSDVQTIKNQGYDEQRVQLTGKFIEHLHKDNYVFEDEQGGRIVVDVDDHDRYRVELNRPVRIYGEVDISHNHREIEIEIDRIENL